MKKLRIVRCLRGILVILSIFVFLSSEIASASLWKKLSIEEMTKKAATILTGKIKETKSEWNESKTQIYTLIDVEVYEYLKGHLPKKRVVLKQLGGTVGDMTLHIVDAPQFIPGEKVLLFLGPGYIPIVGLSQGKFSIETDPKTGKKMIKEPKVHLDDFVDQIKKIMTEGGEE